MYTEMALTARKFALTLAVTGIAVLGSVAIAPAASAAQSAPSQVVQDGPGSVIEKTNGNGPDQFLIGEHGKKPVFICGDDKVKDDKGKDDKGKDEKVKHANKCIDLTAPTRF
jgi:hypothetical protein